MVAVEGGLIFDVSVNGCFPKLLLMESFKHRTAVIGGFKITEGAGVVGYKGAFQEDFLLLADKKFGSGLRCCTKAKQQA